MEHFTVGDRCLMRSPSNTFNEGCILYVSYISDFQSTVGIVFDDDNVNCNPSSKEVELAKQFSVSNSASNVILVNYTIGDNFIEKITNFDVLRIDKQCYLKCCRKSCGKFKRREDMFITCKLPHTICAFHVSPWLDSIHMINEDVLNDYYELAKYQTGCTVATARTIFLKTKCALSFKKWRSACDESIKLKIFQEAMEMKVRVCECCRSIFNQNENGLPVEIWHEQLFGSDFTSLGASVLPGSWSSTSDRAHDDTKNLQRVQGIRNGQISTDECHGLAPRVYSELIRRRVSRSDIEWVTSQQSSKDLQSFDADLVQALLLSTRPLPDHNVMITQETVSECTQSPVIEAGEKLLHNVIITAMSIADNRFRVVRLDSGMGHADVLALIRDALDLHLNVDTLYRVDSDGWSDEITTPQPNSRARGASATPSETVQARVSRPAKHCQYGESEQCSLLSLRDCDPVAVRSSRDCVGPRMRLSSLAAKFKYNSTRRQKAIRLASRYVGWRPIRGDGNCYFRAVIFGLLEHYTQTKNEVAMSSLLQTLQTAVSSRGEDSSEISKQLDTLQKLGEVGNLEAAMLDPTSGLDMALVLACRLLVSKYLQEHEDMDMNGLTLNDAILPSYPDINNMGEYCTKYVEALGVDAEGPLVSGSLLLDALGCFGCTVLLDDRSNVDLTLQGTGPTHLARRGSGTEGPEIHLLLRPGHYDLLYPHPSISDAVPLEFATPTPPKVAKRVLSTKSTINEIAKAAVTEPVPGETHRRPPSIVPQSVDITSRKLSKALGWRSLLTCLYNCNGT